MSDVNGEYLAMPVESELSAYLHAKADRLGVPVSTNFELTKRCNFDCRMCYIHSSNQADNELTARQWIEIGTKAAESGVAFLLLTGGEPLIRKDFPLIYTELKKLGLVISVNTNGSLLKGDILKLFENEPPTRLNVSLYGASDETYGRLCLHPCFSAVAENIKNAVNAGLQVKLNYSITPYNCADIEKVYAFAGELGLHVQSSAYMYPPLRRGGAAFGQNAARLSPEDAALYRIKSERLTLGEERFLKKAERIVSSHGSVPFVSEENECRSRCRAGRSNCWIDWRGNMSMCGMLPAGENSVLKYGFAECWKKVREEAGKIRLPKKCAACEYASLCGICAAVCMCETGSFDIVPEYMCRFSEHTFGGIAECTRGDTERK